MKRYLYYVLVGVVCLAVGVGVGRFATPAKVETKFVDRTVWKTETVVKTVKVAGPVRVRVVTIEKPGGERVTERWIEKDPVTTTTATDQVATGESKSESTKVVTSEYPRLTLGVGVGASYSDILSPSLTVLAGYRLTGPLGVWASASKDRASLGLSLTF